MIHCLYSLRLLILLTTLTGVVHAQIAVYYDPASKPILFGVSQLEKNLKNDGVNNKIVLSGNEREAQIVIKVISDIPSLTKGGYKILRDNNTTHITAIDEGGAMYGILDVAEQLNSGKKLKDLTDKISNPRLSIRAIKFNLPWSPYRTGLVMEQHTEVCRDLLFWQSFLDEMALNRFNVLSLWNVHPFSFMVKPTNFPKANNFSEQEMRSWKDFWTSLFRMAKERGIETFIVNWNIAVSPEFATAYGVKERNDTSAIVKRYTREVVTQVINEYPDLSGIGITLADWMSNFRSANSTLPEMTAKDREDWIEETVVAGIKAANHPVRFLHRSVLSSDPAEMRRVIDNAALADTTLVEVKFNWSHGHSTPILALTHDAHSGKVDNGYWSPLPKNYRIQWMIRNEDFFILRWGQADFIRKHIAHNSEPYVNGYFVGSEGYIPAKDFAHVNNDHKTWKYAFEKQWLFYLLWGRLLYDPSTPDAAFEAQFEHRYGNKSGKTLFAAYSTASKMPLRLASFHGATWDYTLYSEGFLAPFSSPRGLHEDGSSFISINELIDHPPLDTRYLSITDYVVQLNSKTLLPAGKLTPLQLADSLENDSRLVTKLVNQMRPYAKAALTCELDDLETWALLSQYFSDKIRAGVALQKYRTNHVKTEQNKSIDLLTGCLKHWKKLADITSKHYQPVPYLDDQSTASRPENDARTFLWSKYIKEVERDIETAKK